MTVGLKFKELEIMYTQIKRTNGGEKNNAERSFTFPHEGGREGRGGGGGVHTPATHSHSALGSGVSFKAPLKTEVCQI